MTSDMNLVIPTYRNHYTYNINFLNSFSKFCIDKSEVNIKLIVNDSDFVFFNQILSQFDDLNISIETLKNLIYNVDGISVVNDNSIFNSKYPLQSLKKLFSYTICNGDFIVIDSENLCLKNFYFREIIESQKNKPIIYTNHSFQEIQKKVIDSCNTVLTTTSERWFFLKSYWFYEKEIVSKLITDLKKNYGIITHRLQYELIFEYQLYCQYIAKYQLKEMINIDDYCEETIKFTELLVGKKNNFEYLCVELTHTNLIDYLKVIKLLNDKIVRLHWIDSEIKDRIINESEVVIGTFHWD